MVTLYKLKPKAAKSLPLSELFHQTCCDDDVALCGLDVSKLPYTDGVGEQRCVVCFDMLENDTLCRPNCKF